MKQISAEKQALIKQATKLVQLGHRVEEKRKKLRLLVEAGVEYTSNDMFRALDEFNIAKQEWEKEEQAYLAQRSRITNGTNTNFI